MVPDRDYFACPEGEIANTRSLLTLLGGRVVYAAGDFAAHDAPPPPALPDWSPVRRYGGYGAWAQAEGAPLQARLQRAAARRSCASPCAVHGHRHGDGLRAPAGAGPG